MELSYEQLKGMTVAQLRELAGGLEGLTGYTQMPKQRLIEHICEHEGIDMHAHHEVVGVNKRNIKRRIATLKVERDKALETHDSVALKRVRRQIHHLKRRIHRATV